MLAIINVCRHTLPGIIHCIGHSPPYNTDTSCQMTLMSYLLDKRNINAVIKHLKHPPHAPTVLNTSKYCDHDSNMFSVGRSIKLHFLRISLETLWIFCKATVEYVEIYLLPKECYLFEVGVAPFCESFLLYGDSFLLKYSYTAFLKLGPSVPLLQVHGPATNIHINDRYFNIV